MKLNVARIGVCARMLYDKGMDETERFLSDEEQPERKAEETKRIGRVLQLINLISNAPRRWTRRALSERLDVSERQIDKDIVLLRQGLHCELVHTREGYYFTRLPDLPPIGYTAAEALALLTALQFARESGALDAASLGAAMARTEAALPPGFLPLVHLLQRASEHNSPQRQHRAAMLRVLQQGLNERRQVRVVYETASRNGERSERVLQPYHLELEGQSWLLTAHDSLRHTVRDFTIDRIVEAELLEERYEIPPDFDLEQYRGSGWGVLRGMSGTPRHVELRVTAEEARRLRDEMHNASQREVQQADGSWLVTFEVGITPELVRWVFRWGSGCEVLAPAELRTMVAEMARAIGERNAVLGDFRSGQAETS